MPDGEQDRLFCGQKCRSASYYIKTKGGNAEPAGRIMRKVPVDVGEQGHTRVWIVGGGRELVHRLMLRTFNREPLKGEQGCHRDGNAQRNHICNLRWGSQSDNWDDRIRHGNYRVFRKLDRRTVEVIRSRAKAGESNPALAEDYGVSETQIRNILEHRQWATQGPLEWPLANCWKGVSVEDQKTADERIPVLLQTPAAVRFISAEPLLGPIDLTRLPIPPDALLPTHGTSHGFHFNALHRDEDTYAHSTKHHLDWVIVGGESGPGARPTDYQQIRAIVKQCKQASVPVFVKQLGSKPIDGENWGCGWHVKDKKGGNPVEWPYEDLRVREFPSAIRRGET